jgi:hypothetical protein
VERSLLANILLLGLGAETPENFLARVRKNHLERGFYEFAFEVGAGGASSSDLVKSTFDDMRRAGVLRGPRALNFEVGYVETASGRMAPMQYPLLSRWEVEGGVARRVDTPDGILVMRNRRELPKASVILGGGSNSPQAFEAATSAGCR